MAHTSFSLITKSACLPLRAFSRARYTINIKALCHSGCRKALVLSGLLLTLCVNAFGERLPLRSYTSADGLAHNVVNKIFRDSRGFLWFGTNDGLSRFDGYTFTNYGIAEGLPHPTVNDILETPEGDYWVATNGGLCKFNLRGVPANLNKGQEGETSDAPQSMFTVIVPLDNDRLSRAINKLLLDRAGRIWCGTAKGLYRLEQLRERFQLLSIDISIPSEYAEQKYVNALLEDRHGTLWIATPSGLYRRWPDGSAARYGKTDGLSPVVKGHSFANEQFIHCLLEDRRGNLWVGTAHGGLFRLETSPDQRAPVITRAVTDRNGLTTNWVYVLYESTDGKLWVGTNRELAVLTPVDDKTKSSLHVYSQQNGLSASEVLSITEDRNGNLWMGTSIGTVTLAHNGFTTFDSRDWLQQVFSIFESGTGELYVYGQVLGDQRASVFEGATLNLFNPGPLNYMRRLGRFDGQRFTWLLPRALKRDKFYLGWSDKPLALQASTGEWWIGTGGQGLFQFPRTTTFAALERASPNAVYTERDGLAGGDIYCLYEDVHGDVWVSTVSGSTGNGLARWDHETRTIHNMAHIEGLPSLNDRLPTAFQEDRAGNMWVGFNQGELARYTAGRFTVFTSVNGLPSGRINDLYLDQAGRLWIAVTRGGLSRIDNPASEYPTFTNYTTAQGLSGNFVSAITEDAYGRIYVGTSQGIDRLDPATGRFKYYTTSDGLAPGQLAGGFRAQDGQLWFGTNQGLSRFLPEPPKAFADPPPIFITAVRVAGTTQNISANGETDVRLPDFTPGGNQLQIDFVGLSFASGESLRYQFRLDGADKDWGAPTAQRTLYYANLAPGHYRFLVRALSSEGGFSPTPAIVTFTVMPPYWQRWWFLVFAAMTLALIGYVFYRYRLQRLLQIVNIRSRIAMDLHDDIGSNLTRISLLSEVAKQNANDANGSEDSPLMSISRIARESVGSMSDIVWAIDPKADTLLDLTRKMRQHADEVFTLRDIELKFNAPGAKESLRLGVDVRRDLLLIFKEAVNNAARHSKCTKVRVDMQLQASRLLLEIEDNGIGFDDSVETQGHGVRSMKQRVRSLAGTLEFVPNPGSGTIIRVNIPVSRKLAIF